MGTTKGGEMKTETVTEALFVEPTKDTAGSIKAAYDLIHGTDHSGWADHMKDLVPALEALTLLVLDEMPHASIGELAEHALWTFIKDLGVAFDNYDGAPSY